MEEKKYIKIIRRCFWVSLAIIIGWYILSGIYNNLYIILGFMGLVTMIILSYQLIIRVEWLSQLGVKIVNMLAKILTPNEGFDFPHLFNRKYFPSNLISLIKLFIIVIILTGYLPLCVYIVEYTLSYSIPLGIISLFIMMIFGMTTLMCGDKK